MVLIVTAIPYGLIFRSYEITFAHQGVGDRGPSCILLIEVVALVKMLYF